MGCKIWYRWPYSQNINRLVDPENEFTVTENYKLTGYLQGNLQDYKVMIAISWEEERAAHSRTLAWEIPCTEEPSEL